jgi:hypothetical protein
MPNDGIQCPFCSGPGATENSGSYDCAYCGGKFKHVPRISRPAGGAVCEIHACTVLAIGICRSCNRGFCATHQAIIGWSKDGEPIRDSAGCASCQQEIKSAAERDEAYKRRSHYKAIDERRICFVDGREPHGICICCDYGFCEQCILTVGADGPLVRIESPWKGKNTPGFSAEIARPMTLCRRCEGDFAKALRSYLRELGLYERLGKPLIYAEDHYLGTPSILWTRLERRQRRGIIEECARQAERHTMQVQEWLGHYAASGQCPYRRRPERMSQPPWNAE